MIFITDLINIEKIDKRISDQEIHTTLKLLWKPRVLPESLKTTGPQGLFFSRKELTDTYEGNWERWSFSELHFSSEPQNTDSDLSDSLVMCSMHIRAQLFL